MVQKREKWVLARYLIDAKKSVDSIIFISDNYASLQHTDIHEKVSDKRSNFYIKSCVVLDKSFPKQKKKICKENPEIQQLYYERDKNSAHKDDDYKDKKYTTFDELITDLKEQLEQVKKVCKDSLPQNITLDYVSHDRELFRCLWQDKSTYNCNAKVHNLAISVE